MANINFISTRIRSFNLSLIQLFSYSVIQLLIISCSNDMDIINRFIDAEVDPDLIAENVEVLYSDSACLQMRMVTPVTKHFISATYQREEYPEGIHVWFYEKTGEIKGEISANWAKRDIVKDLWETAGNVVAINADGQKLETEQLFWDPKSGTIYSEIFTKITTEDGNVATGDRFTSNQSFTEWKLIKGRATIILRDEEPDEEEMDSVFQRNEQLTEEERTTVLLKEENEKPPVLIKKEEEEEKEKAPVLMKREQPNEKEKATI